MLGLVNRSNKVGVMIRKVRKVRYGLFGEKSTTIYLLLGFIPIYWRATRP